jgi:hypothetical protein
MGPIERSIRRTRDRLRRSLERTKRGFKKSLEKTKRVTGRIDKKIENGFKSIPGAFKKTFTPQLGRKVAGFLTRTFGTTDRVLSAVTGFGDKIFDIPVLGNALKAIAPEFFALNEGLKIADIGARGLAGLTDANNYKDQNGQEVVKNILERAVKTGIEEEKAGAFKNLKFA